MICITINLWRLSSNIENKTNMMKFILFVSLILMFVLGDKPSLKVGLSAPALNAVKDMAINKIQKKVPDFVVPDFNRDFGVAKVSVKNCKMTGNSFVKDQFSVEPVDGTNEVKITGNAGFNGKMDMAITVSITTSDCVATLGTNKAGFFVNVALVSANSRLTADVKDVTMNIVPTDLSLEIPCKITSETKKVLVGHLTQVFSEMIKPILAPAIKQVTGEFMTEILSWLTNDSPLSEDTAFKTDFTESPKTNKGVLELPVKAFIHNAGKGAEFYTPSDLPDFSGAAKGMEVLMSDYILHAGLEAAKVSKKLNFKDYGKSVDDCRWYLTCNEWVVIGVTLVDNAVSVKVSTHCATLVTFPTGYDCSIETTGELSSTVTVKMAKKIVNGKLEFDYSSMELTDLKITDKYYRDYWANRAFNDNSERLVKELTEGKGIPLSILTVMQAKDVEMSNKDHAMVFKGTLI